MAAIAEKNDTKTGTQPAKSRGASKIIDALRGFAAATVMLFHGYSWILAPWNLSAFDGQGAALLHHIEHPSNLYWAAPLYPMLGFGFLGVNLFFIISGFCIHLPNAREKTASLDIPRFLLRRLIRLYPLYISVAGILFIIYGPLTHQYAEKGVTAENILGHFFFWHYLGSRASAGMGISGVMWTIALEVEFYCLYALLFPVIRALGIGRLAIYWVVADAIYHLLWLVVSAHFTLHPVFSPARFAPTRFGEWLLGAWLAERYADGSLGLKPRRAISWGTICIVGGICLGASIGTDKYTSTDIPGCLGFMLITGGLLQLELNNKLKIHPLMTWLGDRSYSLYLVHATVILIISKAFSSRVPADASYRPVLSIIVFFLASAIALVTAAGAYRLIEAPSHRLARRVRQRPKCMFEPA